MIRVEALNHEGSFDLLGLFEGQARGQIDACIAKNEDYFIRVVRTGRHRKILWSNFSKGEL